MSDLAVTRPMLPAATPDWIAKVREIECRGREQPQVRIVTEHILHHGIYTRTICVPKGTEFAGALMKKPTTVTLVGAALVRSGEGSLQHVTGYAVMPASAGRKQVFKALSEFLIVSTAARVDAKTVREAQAELTDDVHLLSPLDDPSLHVIVETGE